MLAYPLRRRLRLVLLALTATMAFAFGCTLLGTRDLVQCQHDTDCTLDPKTCLDGLCVVKSASNVGRGDGSTDAPAASCSSTSECDQTAASVCVAHACLPLVLPEVCPYVTTNGISAASDLHSKSTVVVAAYTNLGNSPTAENAAVTIQVAVTQLHATLTNARLVVLYCKKDGPGERRLDDVLAHLISRGIPAVFGQFETSELNNVSAGNKARVAIWSTLGNADALQGQNQGGSKNLWFFLDQLTNLESGFQNAFDRAAAITNDGGADTRVAILRDESTEATEVDSLAAAVAARLEDGGARPLDAGNVRTATTYYAASTDIVSFAPHVVIGIGGNSILTDVVGRLETNPELTNKPAYVVTSRARYNYATLGSLITKSNPDFKHRFMGVDFSGDHDRWTSYINTAGQLGPGIAPYDQLFDATFAVALVGVHARQLSGDAPITVDTMTDALAILRPSPIPSPSVYDAVGVTSANFNDAVSSATAGTPFVLRGNTGPWIFDAASRSRRMGTSFFCIKSGMVSTYLAFPLNPAECD